jgi:shikimate dehydrogenase
MAPMIYNPYFEKQNIDAVVVPMGCQLDDYETFLPQVTRLSNFLGALVTMSYKRATVGMLDDLSITVEVAGSCNAIRRAADGLLVGDMFDGEGFIRGVKRKGRKVTGHVF